MRYQWDCLAIAIGITVIGCGGAGNVSDPQEWLTYEENESPIAAVGQYAPFDDSEAIAGRVGPFTESVDITDVIIGQAPGWGCATPSEVAVSVWTSPASAPDREPATFLLPVLASEDLGNGFTAIRVRLPTPIEGEVDGYGWIALGLTTADACGAATNGPSNGRAWRWRDGRWSEEVGARFVISARSE